MKILLTITVSKEFAQFRFIDRLFL